MREKIKTFKAGCISEHLANWENITSDHEILSTVKGLPIELQNTPAQHQEHIQQNNFSPAEVPIVDEEISKLIKKGVITESQNVIGQYISPIFLRPKSDGTFRLILNLKKFNELQPKIHFKMDTIWSILNLIKKDCFMAKLDLKDAYYSVSIKPLDRKFLKFVHKGKLYEFCSLPNGLSVGPRKFTKLLKPPLTVLRKQGINVGAYIDDILLINQTFDETFKSTNIAASLFVSLGFIIHPEKSVFTPSQKIEYLGFIIDSREMIVYLTEKRKAKVIELCKSVSNMKRPTIRQVAQLIGTFTSCFPAVKYGPLHYRDLELGKISALKSNNRNFDKPMTLTHQALENIKWWRTHVNTAFKEISLSNPSITICTDASKLGWGATVGHNATSGLWSSTEATEHINVLELKAVLFGIVSLLSHSKECHIKILSDNTTTVYCINNMGTLNSSRCNEVTKSIWNWAIDRNIWLTASHIPGILNTEADYESRRNDSHTEWKLSEEIYNQVTTYFQFTPDIDLFASRINKQVTKFVSYHPDPDAFAVDAFSIDWNGIKFYAFPPFSCVGKMLRKIFADKAYGIIIVPNWPSQSWFSMLYDLYVCEPFVIPPSKKQTYLPNQPAVQHPLYRSLELLTCLVHG